MAHEGYHEPVDRLDRGVIDRHRAIVSIMEELEAVDWYDQRISATDDDELAAVLAHNRDEEKEHAAMTLEWLRRNDPVLDANLRTYLFTEAPVTEVEQLAEGGGDPTEDSHKDASAGAAGPTADHSLHIGSLRIDPADNDTRKEEHP
jgi:ferritin-like protein